MDDVAAAEVCDGVTTTVIGAKLLPGTVTTDVTTPGACVACVVVGTTTGAVVVVDRICDKLDCTTDCCDEMLDCTDEKEDSTLDILLLTEACDEMDEAIEEGTGVGVPASGGIEVSDERLSGMCAVRITTYSRHWERWWR